MTMTKKPTTEACPCGGGIYAGCCAPYHQGLPAPDAETLMRARYSAYVLRLEAYLLATWHADHRPATLELSADPTQWLGLTVRHSAEMGERATVEFVARYKVNGRAHRLHEISQFVRENGRWHYIDGIISE